MHEVHDDSWFSPTIISSLHAPCASRFVHSQMLYQLSYRGAEILKERCNPNRNIAYMMVLFKGYFAHIRKPIALACYLR